MNRKMKARWLAALRSGEYQQCRGKLSADVAGSTAYCCLGVLAKVAGLDVSSMNETIHGYEPIYALIGSSQVARNLAARNDGEDEYAPHSFAEIADIVEREL